MNTFQIDVLIAIAVTFAMSGLVCLLLGYFFDWGIVFGIGIAVWIALIVLLAVGAVFVAWRFALS